MLIGRIFGIPVRVDASWLVVFVLFAWMLASGAGPFAGIPAPWRLLTAVLTVLAVFACIVIHEAAHALVARRFGIPVGGITLFIFGGVSQIETPPGQPVQEAAVAVAGPLASIVLGLLLGLAATLVVPSPALHEALLYLGGLNLLLAAFNLLPAYPLDGGRVLHAALLGMTGSQDRATAIAVGVSTAMGAMMLGVALLLFFAGDVVQGIWIGLLAWFIMGAARAERASDLTLGHLGGVRAGDVADPPESGIAPQVSCAQALEQMIRTSHRALAVNADGHLSGLVTLSDFAKLEGRDPASTPVSAIMTPLPDLRSVTPEVPAVEAFRTLASSRFHQVPVVDEGDRLVGFITRATVLRSLQVRTEAMSSTGGH
ncbi:MAG: site-2 protease family protein [Vulcanimicrobiaceae bacterium]